MIREIKKINDPSLIAELKTFPNQGVLQEIIEKSQSGKIFELQENAVLVMEHCSDPFVFIAGELNNEIIDSALSLVKEREFPMICCHPKFHPLFLKRGWNFHLRVKLSFQNLQEAKILDPNLSIQPIKTQDIFEKCSWYTERSELYGSADNFLRYGTGYALCLASEVVSEAYASIGGGYAEIGVITNPAYRDKGYAGQIVSHLIKHCVGENIIPQWSCNADNKASLSTGLRLGFEVNSYYTLLVPTFGNVLCPNLVNWIKENPYEA